jgi:hypothetical protein
MCDGFSPSGLRRTHWLWVPSTLTRDSAADSLQVQQRAIADAICDCSQRVAQVRQSSLTPIA